jgi:hypothetical protein
VGSVAAADNERSTIKLGATDTSTGQVVSNVVVVGRQGDGPEETVDRRHDQNMDVDPQTWRCTDD